MYNIYYYIYTMILAPNFLNMGGFFQSKQIGGTTRKRLKRRNCTKKRKYIKKGKTNLNT